MTPTSLTQETRSIDPRSRASQQTVADEPPSSADQSFDGVLSTLQEETASAPASEAAPTAPKAGATTPAGALFATVAASAGSKATGTDPTGTLAATARIAAVLADQASGSTAVAASPAGVETSGTSDVRSSHGAGSGRGAKGADGADGPDKATAAAGAAPPPLDLFSMFGITMQQNAAPQARTPGASSVAGATGAAASKPAAKDEGEAEPAVTLASDITSVSHLAPATVLPGIQPSTAATSAAPGQPAADAARPILPAASSKSVAALDAKADAVSPASSTTTGSMQAPIQAIVDAVSHLVSAQVDAPDATRAIAAPAASVPAEKSVSLAPARTMTLQLTPADLGSVSVRLHMTGDTLDVSLGVSNQQTLGLLTREQSSLSSALTSQSYQLNSLVIQGADPTAGSSGGHHASQGDSGDQARSDRDQAGSGARDPNGAARQQNGGRQGPAARPSAGASDSQLYV